MPPRIKVFIVLILCGWAALTAILAAAGAHCSALLAAAIVVMSALAGLYALFVYLPMFDPTGRSAWRGPAAEKAVALTFDDGPGPDTERILDVLKEKDVRATFFFLGENAKRLPGPVTRARAEGHAIGNHGMTHVKMHRLSAASIEREIRGGEAALGVIATAGGRKIVRVPHGFKSITLARTLGVLGYRLIAWTAGVWDSDRPGTDVIVARAMAAIRPGCILLLHDGDGTSPAPDRSQTAAALPAIIEYCLNAGYKFVTIPQLFT